MLVVELNNTARPTFASCREATPVEPAGPPLGRTQTGEAVDAPVPKAESSRPETPNVDAGVTALQVRSEVVSNVVPL